MKHTEFENLVKRRTGLRITEPLSEKLCDSIRERMSVRKMESEAAYLDLLIRDQDEFSCFMNRLTINETYFYREPDQLRLFSEKLIPELLERFGTQRKVNVLSAGCSTGEEAYSLVMAVMESFGSKTAELCNFRGLDIDSDAIRIAKKGIYSEYSFRRTDDHLKARYFNDIGPNSYEVKKVVKDMVKFETFNLLSSPYPQELKDTDIVFYRNVSIYFDHETQKKIFENLSHTISEYGYMILSSTETLPHDIQILTLVEREGVYLFAKDLSLVRKQNSSKSSGDPKKSERVRNRLRAKSVLSKLRLPSDDISYAKKYDLSGDVSDEGRPTRNPDEDLDQALSLGKGKLYLKALDLIDDVLAREPGFTRAYILKAGILVNLNEKDEAEKICLKMIEIDPLCLEGYMLLGIIAKENNEKKTAVKRFQEAVYLDSSCWLAHFYLAEIFRAGGEIERACKEYEIAKNLLEMNGISRPGITFFPIKATTRQMINLCRHNLRNVCTANEPVRRLRIGDSANSNG